MSVKIVDLIKPALLLIGSEQFLIENLNINKSLNNYSTCSAIIPFNSNSKINVGNLGTIDIYADGKYYPVFCGVIKKIKNAFNSVDIELEGIQSFIDYFPLEFSEDEYKYAPETPVNSIINDLIIKSNYVTSGMGIIRNYLSGVVPEEFTIKFGQSLGDALREIASLFGGWIVERGSEIHLTSYSEINYSSVTIDNDLKISEFEVENSDHLYRIIYVRAENDQELDEQSHLPIIKRISNSWVPFPFNKRAIYYTYKGNLTKEGAIRIANSIERRLQIGRYTYSLSYASLLNCEILDRIGNYLIDSIQINYSLDPINLTTTITGFLG